MKFKKDEEGKLVLDDNGDPIAVDEKGDAIDLSKVVAAGKHERVTGELEEYKAKVGDLEAKIEDLNKSVGNAEELKVKVAELTEATEKAKADFESKLAERETEFASKERDNAIDKALLGAGLQGENRLKAARALIDMEAVKYEDGKLSGLDLDTFKQENDYLFATGKTVKTALKSDGSGSEDDSGLRAAMGLPPKEE